jgi:hypothetical protein
MSDEAPADRNRLVVHGTCTVHRGPVGYVNVLVTRLNGAIQLDPHVAGQCVITLAEPEAIELRDALARWLG